MKGGGRVLLLWISTGMNKSVLLLNYRIYSLTVLKSKFGLRLVRTPMMWSLGDIVATDLFAAYNPTFVNLNHQLAN